jgi:hypothetical protein
MATVADLGGVKEPGLLVQSADWNSVVEEVVRLGEEAERLDGEVTRLDSEKASQADLEALRQTILNTLQPTLAALGNRVQVLETILGQFHLVTLQTTKATCVVGDFTEITARALDLEGHPRTFTAQSRPWVDFVATWGRLQAAPGFEATSGATSRSIAVRTDLNGIARVRLRAEAALGISDQDEAAFAQVLSRPSSSTSGKTVEQAILQANTPSEARASGAFDVVDAEYKAGNPGVKRYVDALFVNERQIGFYPADLVFGTFTDYRATVLAFVRADNDPTTPDAARGAGTTQITFREWTQVYAEPPLEIDLEEPPQYIFPPINFFEELVEVPDFVEKFTKNVLDVKGEVERHRRVRETTAWLDEAVPNAGPPGLRIALEQAKGTLGLVAELDQGRVRAAPESSGVTSLIAMASHNEARTKQVEAQARAAQEQTGAVQLALGQVQGQVSNLQGQVAATMAEGGAITIALGEVRQLKTQVDAFDADRVKPTETRVQDINGTIFELHERLALLERR